MLSSALYRLTMTYDLNYLMQGYLYFFCVSLRYIKLYIYYAL